jgi:hypothetical protein
VRGCGDPPPGVLCVRGDTIVMRDALVQSKRRRTVDDMLVRIHDVDGIRHRVFAMNAYERRGDRGEVTLKWKRWLCTYCLILGDRTGQVEQAYSCKFSEDVHCKRCCRNYHCLNAIRVPIMFNELSTQRGSDQVDARCLDYLRQLFDVLQPAPIYSLVKHDVYTTSRRINFSQHCSLVPLALFPTGNGDGSVTIRLYYDQVVGVLHFDGRFEITRSFMIPPLLHTHTQTFYPPYEDSITAIVRFSTSYDIADPTK